MNITDKQLASWVRSQRSRCDDPRRRALLEAIPGWTWNTRDTAWEQGFEYLKKYIKDSHDEYVTPEGYCLGNWISKQRQRCDDPERRKRLESVEGWAWDARVAHFEEGLKNLKKYGASVKQMFVTPEGFKLGVWIVFQRHKCTDPERRKRLESVEGWVWNAREARFEEGLKNLKTYGADVLQSFVTPEGFKLGVWISNLRQDCKDPEKRKRIESVKGWKWKISTEERMKMIAESRRTNKASRK